jgi:hypothetical protein
MNFESSVADAVNMSIERKPPPASNGALPPASVWAKRDGKNLEGKLPRSKN